MWFLLWFQPDWFAAAHGAGFAVRIPTLLLIPVMVIIAMRARREAFYAPYVLFVGLHIVSLPFVLNTGLAMMGLKTILHMYLLFAVTVCILDTPRKTVLLVKLFLLHFIWFGVQGLAWGPEARVSWHIVLGNPDSYGPLMVMGLGFAYYFATGTNSNAYRRLSSVTLLVCMAGAVLSFARGAIISLCVVLLAIWMRSPNRRAAFGYGLVVGAVGLTVTEFAFPGGAFWKEMQTIGDLHTSGTGELRWILWKAAWEVFLTSPIFGVGAWNFGPNAAEYFEWGQIGNKFTDPAKFWAQSLHNDYVQLLSEQGLVGVFAMGAMLLGFRNHLRFLRTEDARLRWRDATGGFIDLRNLSLGLETAMLAYLSNAVFYGHLYFYWFWSLIAIAYVLTMVLRPSEGEAGKRAPFRHRYGEPFPVAGRPSPSTSYPTRPSAIRLQDA